MEHKIHRHPFNGRPATLERPAQVAVRNPVTPMNALFALHNQFGRPENAFRLSGQSALSCFHTLCKVRLRERVDGTSLTLHQNHMAAATGLRKKGKRVLA